MVTTKRFTDLGVAPDLAEVLASHGITEPFPIQELTLPLVLEAHDVIGQARTGSGKTLAFGLPLLQRLEALRGSVQALVIVPTRELCLQVTDDLQRVGGVRNIRVLPIYGGVPLEPQREALRSGVHVAVGTPGRLLDHVRRNNLDLSAVRTLVLDEADEMLDMGFLPDVEQLIDRCPDNRHTLLFSATMPDAVVSLARRYMRHPTFIRAEVEEHTVPPQIDQHFFLVHKLDKPRILARLLQAPGRGLACVFTRTKFMADRLVEELGGLGVDAIAIHGDLRQETRERNLDRFRNGKVEVLVATEVAARGLDIDGVTHVINYDCPEDEKMYLHRVGRTARAGETGVAVTFATFAEADRLNMIRKAVDAAGQPLEEVFSTSEILTERFGLPGETPWGHLGKRARDANESRPRRSQDRASGRGQPRSSERATAAESDRPRAAKGAGDGQKAAEQTGRRSRTRQRSRADGSTAANREKEPAVAGSTREKAPASAGSGDGTRRSRGRGRSRPGSASSEGRQAAAPTGTDEPSEPTPVRRRSKGAARRSGEPSKGSKAPQSDDGPKRTGEPEGPPPGQVHTDRGEGARGGGKPLPDRRVNVEHLP